MPLYVRAGSIIPTTEATEYSAAQAGKDVEIKVYPGADAHFTLYEDEGDNYNYERGDYTVIPLSWNDKRQQLTIGRRQGSFAGMPQRRTFIITTPSSQKKITYDGKEIAVTM